MLCEHDLCFLQIQRQYILKCTFVPRVVMLYYICVSCSGLSLDIPTNPVSFVSGADNLADFNYGYDCNQAPVRGRPCLMPSENALMEKIEQILVDPLSLHTLVNPVVAADGFTYSLKDLKTWLEKNDTSPMTNAKLHSKTLYDNILIKNILDLFNERAVELFKTIKDEVTPDKATEKFQILLKEGVLKETEDEALVLASEYGKLDMVNSLLENNANVNAVNGLGWTSLCIATKKITKK